MTKRLPGRLAGVKVFLSSITFSGTGINGSTVSNLLKDAIIIGGGLKFVGNSISFAAGDSEIVFASLTSVYTIEMTNNDFAFPALEFVSQSVRLYNNKMLKTISMPNLVRVGDDGAYFQKNSALTSLQLSSLVFVNRGVDISNNPFLTTHYVRVSKEF